LWVGLNALCELHCTTVLLQTVSFLQVCLKILTCPFVLQVSYMLIIPSVGKKRKCTKSNTFLINSFTIPSHLYRHHISYHKYSTNVMKQGNQFIFFSRYRKQRTSIIRRRFYTRTCDWWQPCKHKWVTRRYF